jgi:hypothetical protein
MKTMASISAGIAVIASIVSVNLWRELRAERQANDELRTQVTAARTANSAPAMPAPVTANLVPTATVNGAAEAPVCKPESPPKATQTASANALQNSLNLQNELMKDPEYRKLRLAQQRMNMERNYPGLAEELGLSEKEAEKLFDLLAENQTAMSAESPLPLLSANGTQDQPAMEEAMRRRQALQRQHDEALRSMLGGKYSQWQDYQQVSRPARTRVMSMGTQLAQAGLPLTDAQTRSLTPVMIAEQQRQMQEARAMPRTAPVNPTDLDARAKMLEESLKRNEDNNRRMINVVAPHMSAPQLAAYRNQVEQQAAMNRISMKMQIEQQRLQAQSQPQQ